MDITYDTPELRARLDALSKECVALHVPPPPVTWLTLKVEDADGNVVSNETIKANSWVRNFYNSMALFLGLPAVTTGAYGAGCLRTMDTSGSTKNVSEYGDALPPRGGSAGSAATGIVVGTGVEAESFESVVLGTPVAEGTGAGQMSYLAGTLGTPSYNAVTKKWTQTITRIINNNSAGAIVVTEVGIVAYTSNNKNTLIDRTLLPAAVTVPAANKLTVTYTTEMTFPA